MFPIPSSKIESIVGHVNGIFSPLSWGGEGVGEIKQITNGWNVLPTKVFPSFSIFILYMTASGQSPEMRTALVFLFLFSTAMVLEAPNSSPAPNVQDIVPEDAYLIFPECSS